MIRKNNKNVIKIIKINLNQIKNQNDCCFQTKRIFLAELNKNTRTKSNNT